MPWISPTAATVKARISGPEFEALKSAARSAGQVADTLVDDTISRVINLIRGFVARKYTLGVTGTIPDELESCVGTLFVYEFITRLPGMSKLLDERRTKAYDDAMRLLRDVASGTFVIVPPETPAADNLQASPHGIEVVSSRTRVADTISTAGLL